MLKHWHRRMARALSSKDSLSLSLSLVLVSFLPPSASAKVAQLRDKAHLLVLLRRCRLPACLAPPLPVHHHHGRSGPVRSATKQTNQPSSAPARGEERRGEGRWGRGRHGGQNCLLASAARCVLPERDRTDIGGRE